MMKQEGPATMKMIRLFAAAIALALAAATAALPQPAAAYSYAAAGKEPMLDGREAILSAVQKGDWDSVGQSVTGLQGEIAYLDENEAKGIKAEFDKAVTDKSADQMSAALNRAFVAEIERRLNGAKDNLKDYQTAKVLVVKAKLFFDAFSGDLDPAKRKTADAGLNQALEAIGNPGIFGAGSKPANPEAFQAAEDSILTALRG
ncbi:hypothetical protein [Radicibacter daui]|uniref:hypothetical protein n=1 Tax=Radicibacter daui TaxID=3064829 RepID=UPI004046EDFF